MKRLIIGVALLSAACGGSSPSAPTPIVTPAPPIVTPPPVVQNITLAPCPSSVPGLDLAFYLQIGCNAFDGPTQSLVRRWTVAPRLYIRTVDEAGAPIDAVTLDTVQNAMTSTASQLTGGKFGVSVERGTSTKEGVSGYVTVKWPAVDAFPGCGLADVAIDGGTIQMNYHRATCACGGSMVYARSAAHELGHAFGYFHTDQQADLMYGKVPATCEASISSRELAAMAYHYR